MNGNIGRFVFLMTLIIRMTAGTAEAKTIYLAETGDDGNTGTNGWADAKRTLQAAHDAAAALDTILVSNGVYSTAYVGTNVVTVITASLTFESMNGRDHTFIDGGGETGSNRCIRINSHNVVFRGFTIRNGFIVNIGEGGAALLLRSGTNVLFESCSIISNTAKVNTATGVYGGAVRDWNDALERTGRLTFRDCLVKDNGYIRDGAGMVYGVLNRVRLERCTVSGNRSHRYAVCHQCTAFDSTIVSNIVDDSTGTGGGVNMEAPATGIWTNEIFNCTIAHNACNNTSGGGVHIYGGRGIIRNCLIVGNQASSGGGISAANTASVDLRVENCTIVANQSLGDYNGIATAGGGIIKGTTLGNVRIFNTILYYNKCNHANNAPRANLHTLYVTNLFNICATTNEAVGGTLPGENNVTADPRFVNWGFGSGTNWSGGDLKLLKTSPCLDAGANIEWTLAPDAVDLDGNPRIKHNLVDMGAYELRLPGGTIISME